MSFPYFAVLCWWLHLVELNHISLNHDVKRQVINKIAISVWDIIRETHSYECYGDIYLFIISYFVLSKNHFLNLFFFNSRVKWKLLTMNSGLENWFFTSCFAMGN